MRKQSIRFETFDIVMIELTTCMTEETRFRKVHKEKGEKRYKEDDIGLSDDLKAIAVYQETEDALSFGKRVAEYYGCPYKIRKHSNCPVGGEFELRIYF